MTSRHASSTTHGGVCWMPQVRHFDDLASAEMAFATDAWVIRHSLRKLLEAKDAAVRAVL
jgi:hypothetical protein